MRRRHPDVPAQAGAEGASGHTAHPHVFVIDKHGRPLQPCHPARARQLLKAGRAVVVRHTPFVIRLKNRIVQTSVVAGVEVGIDPGSKATGIAVFTLHQPNPADTDAGPTRGDPVRPQRTLTHATGLTVHVATGGRTKWNRSRCGLPKSHTLDALCVGRMGATLRAPAKVLVAAAASRGSYQRTRPDTFGFPRLRLPRVKQVHGFATGDLVRAVVPAGKRTGTHVGRVAVRASGKFNIRTCSGLVQGISHRYRRLLQHADGYGYHWNRERQEERVSSPGVHAGVSTRSIR